MFRNPTVVKVAVAALALSVPLAACGDDDEAATTTAAAASWVPDPRP